MVHNFRAGQLREHVSAWESLTSDSFILDAIKHYHIEFESEVPYQAQEPRHIYSSLSDTEVIDGEISKLLFKGVIERTGHTGNGIVSNVFVRPKKDGTYRMILNLKPLNEFVVYQHFKMDNILTALKLMRPKCFMASVDLKDAYYSVPIALEDRKFLKFEWKGAYYQYTCLPNGLACAPRLFTKILKPIYAHLHSVGHVSMGHIDDSFLVGYTRSACELNIQHTVECFDSLGFVIHPEKSVLIPTQELEFLGFLLNSISMTIRLPPSKAAHVKSACENLLSKTKVTIRELAHVIGLLVSSLPGVQFGRLHYRQLEKDKSRALQLCKGNYDGPVTLSNDSRSELQWWVNNITSSFMPITQDKPDFILTTDASKIGWGAVCGDHKTGGCWDLDEQQYHINYLESKAVLLGLKSLCSGTQNKHIRIQSDNTTTVAYLNAMGGIKSLHCNNMAIQIWEWCSQRNIWISASHIPGSTNVEADKESRKINDSTEWSLSMIVYHRLAQLWGPFQVDLFASRLNFKVPVYVSWRPDPGAMFTNAFFMSWGPYYFYAFPPFSLITLCLQKIEEDQSSGVLLVPLWPTQPWFPVLLRSLVDHPRLLPQPRDLLTQPHSTTPHPLGKTLKLLACQVSGKASSRETFQRQLHPSSCSPGLPTPISSTNHMSHSGSNFVVDGKLIHMIPL